MNKHLNFSKEEYSILKNGKIMFVKKIEKIIS